MPVDEPRSPGTVVVVLPDLGRANAASGGELGGHARGNKLGRLSELLAKRTGLRTERLIGDRSPYELYETEQRNNDTAFPTAQSLTRFWRIDARAEGIDPVELVGILNEIGASTGEVTAAYAELPVAPLPPLFDDADPLTAEQGYLRPGPLGVGAHAVRHLQGGRGEDIALADVEQAWRVTHEEYAGRPVPLIWGRDRDGHDLDGNHGNGVLALIGAADNGVGIVGIAPQIRTMLRASHFRRGESLHVEEAIVAAADRMRPGDILLLEVQRLLPDPLPQPLVPTEVQRADFEAIRYACAKGLIVVAAAGNSGRDLDVTPPVPEPNTVRWWFERADGLDSGAILVGAGDPAECPGHQRHQRWADSNFGRVHCHAWGARVTTATAAGYTSTFGGTSAAAAIVAGVAVVVQAMHAKANGGAMLDAAAMRALLIDEALGTPQCPDVAGHVGPMPDLAKIAGAIGAVPR